MNEPKRIRVVYIGLNADVNRSVRRLYDQSQNVGMQTVVWPSDQIPEADLYVSETLESFEDLHVGRMPGWVGLAKNLSSKYSGKAPPLVVLSDFPKRDIPLGNAQNVRIRTLSGGDHIKEMEEMIDEFFNEQKSLKS